MKITRVNVEEYARKKGWELINEPTIPDGFVWKEPDITIGTQEIKGRIIRFKPLADWQDENAITYGEE